MADDIDAALASAVKSTARQRHAQESHERQKKLSQTRGRQARATVKAKKVASLETIQARTAARTQEREAASAIKLQTSRQNRAARIQEQRAAQPSRSQRYANAAGQKAVSTTTSTATPSGDSNLVMVTIFVMAGLIVVYQLVTKGPAVGGFLGGVGDWLHTLSSNSPLFIAQQSQVK